MEAGFARMNCLTVIQTSQGLAEYLIKHYRGRERLKVVIGFDGRRHSKHFAELAAAAFLAKGIEVIWFRETVHTPLVPFTVRARRLNAGIMVTASHNPKDDNGYKVYGSNGCQINAPEDRLIAREILENLEPHTWSVDGVQYLEDSLQQIQAEYIDRIVQATQAGISFPPIVYTPMHGVGLKFFLAAVSRLMPPPSSSSVETDSSNSLSQHLQSFVQIVAEQAQPDPEFPTVKFPNPEEHGALDLAKAEADKHGFRLVIASDPDADRFAVAQRLDDGNWYQFSGDEIGVLLGFHVWTKNRGGSHIPIRTLMITSAVSSQMLAAIGEKEGFEVQETLTGFKWIGNQALRSEGKALFGYEEALGYMMPDIVLDKDGISAACIFLEACSHWKRLPYAVLQDLYNKYGYFATANTYWKSPSLELTQQTFEEIRADPKAILRFFDGFTEFRVRDAVAGTDTGNADGVSSLPVVADNLMITVWLSSRPELEVGVRLTIRASGTEPKIKGKN